MAKNKILKPSSPAIQPQKEAEEPSSGMVQIVQGNTPVLTIQVLAQINKNIVELAKKMDELINIAKS